MSWAPGSGSEEMPDRPVSTGTRRRVDRGAPGYSIGPGRVAPPVCRRPDAGICHSSAPRRDHGLAARRVEDVPGLKRPVIARAGKGCRRAASVSVPDAFAGCACGLPIDSDRTISGQRAGAARTTRRTNRRCAPRARRRLQQSVTGAGPVGVRSAPWWRRADVSSVALSSGGAARGEDETDHERTTFSAAGPFSPCTMSNSTRSPSARVLKPSPEMPE